MVWVEKTLKKLGKEPNGFHSLKSVSSGEMLS